MKTLTTALLFTAIALPATAHNAGGKTGVLHATAQASADIVPDRAAITAGVESEARTAQEAMAKNSEQMRKVYDALARAGVPERDVSTSYLNLSQRYDYDPQGRTRINPRYAVTNQVNISTTDLDGVGPLIDALLEAGLNNIQNVSFTVRDTEAAMDKARTEAIRKARGKAMAMADAAGVRLGDLLALTEGSAPAAFNDEIIATGARVQSLSAAPPLSPGQRELSATVTLSYAID